MEVKKKEKEKKKVAKIYPPLFFFSFQSDRHSNSVIIWPFFPPGGVFPGNFLVHLQMEGSRWLRKGRRGVDDEVLEGK